MEQPPSGSNDDDTGSVTSQGSRRSERLRDKKRSRDDEEPTAASPGRPKTRQRRTSTTPGRTSGAGQQATTTEQSTPMDLETIPEEVSTTNNENQDPPTSTPQRHRPQEPVDPDQTELQPAPVATPPPAATPLPQHSYITGQLPPVTPGRLLPSATAAPIQTSVATATAFAPKSSKKLLSLDNKSETPFKRAKDTTILHDGNDAARNEQKDHENDDDEILPEEQAPLVPNTPREEEPPNMIYNFGQQVFQRHGHRLVSLRFWMLFLLILQLVFYPITFHPILTGTTALSRRLLSFYRSVLVTPEPDQTPELVKLQEQLAEIHDREKQAIRVMLHKRTELQNIVQGFISQSQADLATYQASLSTVVNLSMPVVWPTPDGDSNACPDRTIDGGGSVSVAEAAATIRDTYRSQLAALVDESDVEGWIQQHLPTRTVDRNLFRLQQLITDRIEQDRADFDYTHKVIASTGNFVNQLPWLNRLMALWGLRFYGHGASAAILPNRPRGSSSMSSPSSSMGQCWALIPPATAVIELSKSIYVQSVSIEHPSNAPESSAIHQFSLYAVDANSRMWPLGNFAYDNKQGGRQDYMVRDEYKDEEIPPVRVVKLMVDGSWAGEENLTCLYRFRVFGEEDEKPIDTKKERVQHGKNWGTT